MVTHPSSATIFPSTEIHHRLENKGKTVVFSCFPSTILHGYPWTTGIIRGINRGINSPAQVLMPLTDVKCKSAKPKEKPYKLSDSQGLYLEVLPSGGKYWRMKYYFHGKEKRVSFGVYPQISLAEAREKQVEAKKQLANGINPVQAKADKKLADAVKHMNNFEAIARDWHEKNKEMWVERHRDNIMARLERDVFPVIGHRPIADITTPELKTVLDKIEGRKAYDIAKRTRQVCDQIYRYAIGIGIAERNIARDLQGTLKKVEATHFASITIEELPEFLKRINANAGRHFPSTLHATKLMLLTFVRTAELRGACWSEIDFEHKRWEIPAARMKSKRAHIVPLSHQAIIYCEARKSL